jgi:hypothetical protein
MNHSHRMKSKQLIQIHITMEVMLESEQPKINL